MKPKSKDKLSIVATKDIPVALDVPTDNLLNIFKIITQMENLCYNLEGIGLSATQVGIPWKLFIVERNASYEYYLNCHYVGLGEKSKSIEGCLSLKNDQGLRRFEVDRFSNIILVGQQLKIIDSQLVLENVRREEKDLYAVVFQHEIDHNFGREKMIDVIGTEIELTR